MIKGRWHLMALLKFCCRSDRNAIFIHAQQWGAANTHTHTSLRLCTHETCVSARIWLSGCQACFMGHPQRLCYLVYLQRAQNHYNTHPHTHTPTHPEGLCWCSTPFKTPCSEPRQQRNQSDLTGHLCASHSRGINEHFLCFENTAALVHHTDRDVQLLKTSKGGRLERKKKRTRIRKCCFVISWQ